MFFSFIFAAIVALIARMATYTPTAVVAMTSLTAVAGTSVLTGTNSHQYIVRTIHAGSSGSGKTFTMSFGADAAGTRLFDAYALTASVPLVYNGWWVKAGSGAAHDIDASCGATTVAFTAGGYDYV